MRPTIDDERLVKWMWKNDVKNAWSICFWQKMKSWWGEDTDQNITVIFLTSLIFAVGWALCGGPQPEHESVMLLRSLSPLNDLTH